MPSNPNSTRCCSVNNEHGSTPSILRSRGRGGNDNPVDSGGADGDGAAPVHPPVSTSTMISRTPRINRP